MLETRIVRFANFSGPLGTRQHGREKTPAMICRRAAVAKVTDNPDIEIWGDGEQTRSFCYIDDCITCLYKFMRSDYQDPPNLGQDRLVTINQLVNMAASIAGIWVVKRPVPVPQCVPGRNSDNTRLRSMLHWEPGISLEEGLARTYRWIEGRVPSQLQAEPDPPSRA